jgi:SAM-dependent methyltransferase
VRGTHEPRHGAFPPTNGYPVSDAIEHPRGHRHGDGEEEPTAHWVRLPRVAGRETLDRPTDTPDFRSRGTHTDRRNIERRRLRGERRDRVPRETSTVPAHDPPVTPTSGWSDPEQVAWYTERIGKLEARRAGEQMLIEVLPVAPRRMLDLGCGDGRVSALVLDARPAIKVAVAVDISPPMLDLARNKFADDERVAVRTWDLRDSIASLGTFDVVASGFAIHHLTDERKRSLLVEVADQLSPGGTFANLEVVASATPQRHAEFLAAIGRGADDADDLLASVEDQLTWMREAGLTNVDCLWRWRGFALLVGEARR